MVADNGPSPEMSQVVRIDHPGKRAFLAAYASGGVFKAAAHAAGVDRRTIYRWKADDEDFAQAFAEAEQDAADELEGKARDMAMGGNSDLIKFLLQGLRPEKFRPAVQHQHTGPGGGPIQIDSRAVTLQIMADPEALELALALHRKLDEAAEREALPEAAPTDEGKAQ